MEQEESAMKIQGILEAIRNIECFAVPRERYSDGLPRSLAGISVPASQHWLIPCSHVFNAPATAMDITGLSIQLGQQTPIQLQSFLELANGAELFRIHYQPAGYDDYWIARYKILDCSQLEQVNQGLLEVFSSYAECDDECLDRGRLDYLAFCDVGDGNYLAINLEGTHAGNVFFLDHEYAFYPFGSQETREAYNHVATSLTEWLSCLVQTSGWDGLGGRFIPL